MLGEVGHGLRRTDLQLEKLQSEILSFIETRSKNWNKENAGKASQKQLRYYYRRKEQTPIGLSEDEQQELKRLYKKAQEETMKTGIQHHVDHIIPLSKGGLHLPSNIQVITALENFKKGTRLA